MINGFNISAFNYREIGTSRTETVVKELKINTDVLEGSFKIKFELKDGALVDPSLQDDYDYIEREEARIADLNENAAGLEPDA